MTQPWEEPLARSAVYELISLAFLYPVKGTAALLAEKAGTVESVASPLAWTDVREASRQVREHVGHLTDEALLSDYVDIFGHGVSGDCPQYEGEYSQPHIFLKAQTLADLNTFYSAFGVSVNPELKERLDHISIEMEFMHLLTLKEAYAHINNHGEEKVLLCREAQEAFLARHLATWVPSFVQRVGRKAGSGTTYGSLARLLEAHMSAELRTFQLTPAPARQTALPLAQEEPDCGACPVAAQPSQESGMP